MAKTDTAAPGQRERDAANRSRNLLSLTFLLERRLPCTRMELHWTDFYIAGFQSQVIKTSDTKEQYIPGQYTRKTEKAGEVWPIDTPVLVQVPKSRGAWSPREA